MRYREVLLVLVAVVGLAAADGDLTYVPFTAENGTDLDCGAGSASVRWFYKNAVLESTSSPLHVDEKSQLGTYTCELNGANKTFEVVMVDKTVVKHSHKSLTFNNGDENRMIFCANEASVPEVTFAWFYRKEDSDVAVPLTNNANYTIVSNLINSTITIRSVIYEHRGYYKCVGTNVAGSTESEVLVRVKDRLAALWPFLGIVAEVAILIVVIFFYEKKSKKAAAAAEVSGDSPATKDESVPLKADNAADAEDIRLRQTRNNNSK